MESYSLYLSFNGSLILLFGLLCGVPYAKAINANAEEHIVNSWRVAHASLPMGAILMFAVAALLPHFTVDPLLKWIICWAFIVSGYSFCVSLPVAALTGKRGLTRDTKFSSNVAYWGNLSGALSSLIASISLVFATFASFQFLK